MLGVCDDGLINLNEFKRILQHFKYQLNVKLEYRERMEDIIRINKDESSEFELNYVCKDFYLDIQKHLYGIQSDGRIKSHMLVKDLVKILTLGFQNPEFYSISQFLCGFSDIQDGELDFEQFVTFVKELHKRQVVAVQSFAMSVRDLVKDSQCKNTLVQIHESFALANQINLLSGMHVKLYDVVDALTCDQKHDNTFDMIDLIQKFDENWSGIIDLDEFEKLIYSMR